MNIILLNPPPNDRSWYRVEHLGIAYLAAYLREKGHIVQLLDSLLEELDETGTCDAVMHRMPYVDILGITATEPQTIFSGVEIVRLLKQKGINPFVVAGGYLPTFWHEALLHKYHEIDCIVLGEGEEALNDLANALERKTTIDKIPGLALRNNGGDVILTPIRRLIPNLDTLPFPARDYLPLAYKKYHHAVISASRGCHHKCSFCQISQFYRLSSGRPYRSRSAANIADEIEILINQYDVRSIFFVDDEFITNSPKRKHILRDLINEIRKRGLKFSFSIQYRADTGAQEELLEELKDVGLSTVFIGVESGVDSVLNRFEKGINRIDIQRSLQIVKNLELNLIVGYMIYDPHTTFEELKASIEYLLTPEAPSLQDIHGMMVLKGTLEEKLLQEKNLAIERDFKINYRIPDKRVEAFADLLRHYFPIYRSAVLDIYELLFMLVNLPQEIQAEKKQIDAKLRELHLYFLKTAITELSQGKLLDEAPLLDEMKNAFASLSIETQHFVSKGKESIQDTSNPNYP